MIRLPEQCAQERAVHYFRRFLLTWWLWEGLDLSPLWWHSATTAHSSLIVTPNRRMTSAVNQQYSSGAYYFFRFLTPSPGISYVLNLNALETRKSSPNFILEQSTRLEHQQEKRGRGPRNPARALGDRRALEGSTPSEWTFGCRFRTSQFV